MQQGVALNCFWGSQGCGVVGCSAATQGPRGGAGLVGKRPACWVLRAREQHSIDNTPAAISLPCADTELVLQKLVAIVAVGHTITGAAAGWLAQQEGRPWLVPALKGVAFGAMGLYEETSRKN